jgi:hypothetical protein
MTKTIFLLITLSFIVALTACQQAEKKKERIEPLTFNSDMLRLNATDDVPKMSGQLLYMPVYSNVPYKKSERQFNLDAFVAIHNTDLNHPITLSNVLFFDNEGHLITKYLQKDTLISPLGACNFHISPKVQNGTGANFLVEWVADTLVNEPLVETVMVGLSNNQGVSFSSRGKVIRERR